MTFLSSQKTSTRRARIQWRCKALQLHLQVLVQHIEDMFDHCSLEAMSWVANKPNSYVLTCEALFSSDRKYRVDTLDRLIPGQ